MNRSILLGIVLGSMFAADMAMAIAPIDIEVHCPDGYTRGATGECKRIDQTFTFPKMATTKPDDQGSGRVKSRKCIMPGTTHDPNLPKCVLGAGSGNATQEEIDYWRLINGKSGQDPDMSDREGVPPSVGAGTR
jgi:hypothetical protein